MMNSFVKTLLRDFSFYHVRNYLGETQKGPSDQVLTMLTTGSLIEQSRIICNMFPVFINL